MAGTFELAAKIKNHAQGSSPVENLRRKPRIIGLLRDI